MALSSIAHSSSNNNDEKTVNKSQLVFIAEEPLTSADSPSSTSSAHTVSNVEGIDLWGQRILAKSAQSISGLLDRLDRINWHPFFRVIQTCTDPTTGSQFFSQSVFFLSTLPLKARSSPQSWSTTPIYFAWSPVTDLEIMWPWGLVCRQHKGVDWPVTVISAGITSDRSRWTTVTAEASVRSTPMS